MTLRNLVFVYGTLKKGEPNHHVLKEGNGSFAFVGQGRTVHEFPLIVGSKFNIPFLLRQPGEGHKINGEVYSVDDEKFQALDELEAYPQFYTREEEEIELANGNSVKAWIYMLPKWRPELLETATSFLESYSSKGSHGREYVDRYIRAKEMLESEYNLVEEIRGKEPSSD